MAHMKHISSVNTITQCTKYTNTIQIYYTKNMNKTEKERKKMYQIYEHNPQLLVLNLILKVWLRRKFEIIITKIMHQTVLNLILCKQWFQLNETKLPHNDAQFCSPKIITNFILPESELFEPHQSRMRKVLHLKLHSLESTSILVDEEGDLSGQWVENLESKRKKWN